MNYHKKRYAEDPEYREYKKLKAKEWYENNKQRRRERLMMKNYGLSWDSYLSIIEEQGGCGICCKQEPDHLDSGEMFAVDHDHATGEVRGVLCTQCNTGLGKFYDSVELLQKAQEYLNK